MAKVPLRAYDHEIEGLIEQGHRLDEAVAHCRHILRTYPKHLETYRLLGKAYLEAKHYDQAVDIFQRVLVSAPDDFVSHVGMSIIADYQGNLDDSIWHMERAFEVQPSNAAIQAELQRLFGRRDGVEPPKIRLTRGALAHMYVQGELYTQAISEIRAVLSHDVKRTDLQVLLASAYFRNGQKAEAADVCSALLAISPYCLEANRLMAEILGGAQAAEAAREHRRRLIELDPYAEFASGSLSSTETVADGAVTLQRLDYAGQKPEAFSAQGIALESSFVGSEKAAPPPGWLTSTTATDFGSEDEGHGEVPEFMQEGGWKEVEPGTPEVAEVSSAESGLEVVAVPGNLPEWVKALAPADESGREPFAQESPEPVPSDLPVMEDSIPAAPATAETIGGDNVAPVWLRDSGMGFDGSPQVPEVSERAPSEAESESGELGGLGTAPQQQDDALAWLEGLAEKHGAKPEELLTAPGARPSAPVGTEAARQIPDQRPFDWLGGLSDKDTYAKMENDAQVDQEPIMGEPGAEAWARPEHGASAGDVPDWLTSSPSMPGDTSPGVAREPPRKNEPAAALPDWLAGLDAERAAPPPAGAQVAATENVRDWLQSEREAEPESTAMPVSEWHPAEPERASSTSDTGLHRPPKAAGAVPEARAFEPVRVTEPGLDAQIPEPLPARTRTVPATLKTGVPSLDGAQTELGRGNIAAALDLYEKLIRKGKSLEEIIRHLRDALYRYPVEVPIWQALGDAYMRANRLQEALDAYTKAEELLR